MLTKAFSETVKEQIEKDSRLAVALLEEAFCLTMNGDPKTARLILRDIVNSTMGFEELARMTGKPSKSLHRMLSVKGNPTMNNFNLIFSTLCRNLEVGYEITTVPLAESDQEILRQADLSSKVETKKVLPGTECIGAIEASINALDLISLSLESADLGQTINELVEDNIDKLAGSTDFIEQKDESYISDLD